MTATTPRGETQGEDAERAEPQAQAELLRARTRLADGLAHLFNTVRVLLILTAGCAYAALLGFLAKQLLHR